VIRKIRPEEQEKYKVDLEEAYFYLGFYYFKGAKDMGMARCGSRSRKALNAGTANTKVGSGYASYQGTQGRIPHWLRPT
jgi:hypothetical protein